MSHRLAVSYLQLATRSAELAPSDWGLTTTPHCGAAWSVIRWWLTTVGHWWPVRLGCEYTSPLCCISARCRPSELGLCSVTGDLVGRSSLAMPNDVATAGCESTVRRRYVGGRSRRYVPTYAGFVRGNARWRSVGVIWNVETCAAVTREAASCPLL